MTTPPRWRLLAAVPVTPPELRAWLRTRAGLRRRWLAAPCREPEWMALFERIEEAEARKRRGEKR